MFYPTTRLVTVTHLKSVDKLSTQREIFMICYFHSQKETATSIIKGYTPAFPSNYFTSKNSLEPIIFSSIRIAVHPLFKSHLFKSHTTTWRYPTMENSTNGKSKENVTLKTQETKENISESIDTIASFLFEAIKRKSNEQQQRKGA